MGTITARKRKDGTTAYTAQIRIKRKGHAPYSESETFDRRQAASAWLRKREGELATPGALDKPKVPDPALSVVIDRYIAESEREVGRTKAQVLRAIKANDIGSIQCSKIASADIVTFARGLQVEPQTRGNYLSHLASIFAIAKPAWGYPLNAEAMDDAFKVLRRLGVTSKSRQRDRRPTLDELDLILEHFVDRQKRRPSSNPMAIILAFALFSTRRLEEITRIAWTDFEEQHGRVLVRDMKNPGEKIGNHVWCDLPPEAIQLIKAMPKTADAIFPFNGDSVSTAFTRAVALLGIEDLHFHDLRHEGVSRLFEMGRTIPQVASVSGHRSWGSLQRYAHLRQVGDKYEGWRWLDILASAGRPE